ncbi:MAG: VOC family protein [Acidobacteriota bacterium]
MSEPGPNPRTVAIQACRMDAMVAFYTEAFGARFRPVDTFGLASQFGELPGGCELKLVPLREAVDFEGFPSHQLGFDVADVRAVIALAERHGGRQEGELREEGGRLHGAVRDPDGNTVELYSPA